jgi:hypothetical protein
MKRHIFLAITIFLTACSRQDIPQELSSDATLRQKITGTWSVDNEVVTFSSDGSCSAKFTNTLNILVLDETWKIKEGDIIMTVTNTHSGWGTTNRVAVGAVNHLKYMAPGTVQHFRIIQMDDTNLVWRESGGVAISMKRKP